MNSDIVCDLSHLGAIAATGPEAVSFLQGQLTNDIATLSAESSQLAAYCSPKGRMLALFRLFMRGETIVMAAPRERIQPTLSRLQMFLLRAKASLDDASDSLIGIGVSGPNAERLLGTALDQAVPTDINTAVSVAGYSIIRVAGQQPRYLCYASAADGSALRQALTAAGATSGTANAWRLLDIRAGLPAVYDATADEFIPQTANLHRLDAISFNKGCYVGQEVIARSQYLGKLKRGLYAIHGDTAPPAPGEKLFAAAKPAADGGQSVGQVVDACASPSADSGGGFEGLAVMVDEYAQNQTSAQTAANATIQLKSVSD